MTNVKLLDCTLRDGGYINNWNFGHSNIQSMIRNQEKTNAEILELGFLKSEPYLQDRTVFNRQEQILPLIPEKKPGIEYAAMVEVVNPLPLAELSERRQDGIDIIRVIVWKTKHTATGEVVDALEEGFQYCKGIAERGYKLCIQPARVDLYSDEEFIQMLRRFSALHPTAIYVVDSWGTLNAEELMHYMHLADANMPASISLGYHGHNNMMQAFGVTQAMLREGFTRQLIVDASVYGIGRGAGNLNTEVIAKYLNDHYGKHYELAPMLEIYDRQIKDIYAQEAWGYSIPHFITALYHSNPDYGRYFYGKLKLSSRDIEWILQRMTDDEKTMFSESRANGLYQSFMQNLQTSE